VSPAIRLELDWGEVLELKKKLLKGFVFGVLCVCSGLFFLTGSLAICYLEGSWIDKLVVSGMHFALGFAGMLSLILAFKKNPPKEGTR